MGPREGALHTPHSNITPVSGRGAPSEFLGEAMPVAPCAPEALHARHRRMFAEDRRLAILPLLHTQLFKHGPPRVLAVLLRHAQFVSGASAFLDAVEVVVL